MRIDLLQLQNFRNYQSGTFDFHQSCNVIFGENAQGKTNLLEAIRFLSCARSPRTYSEKELIAFQQDRCRLTGRIFSQDRMRTITMELQRGQRHKTWINQVPLKKTDNGSALFHTVYFCPEDLFLIREGAAERRRFMDDSLCQLRPRYAEALKEYHRLYEHKTRILRDSEEKPDLLSALPEFNAQMVAAGSVLIHYRAQFVQRLTEYAELTHRECSGQREKLTLQYETVSTVSDPFAPMQTLQSQLELRQKQLYEAEISSRLCLCGPHKDDMSIQINGIPAKNFGSQGQVRTAALSLKLAEREIHKNVTGEYPVLLLDDVLSELDEKRQEYVLSRIQNGQVFITCCEDDRLGAMLQGKVFHIRQGSVV